MRTPTEWRARRTEIRQLYEKYDLGTFPPKPKLDRAVVLDETPGKGYLDPQRPPGIRPRKQRDHARAGDDPRRQGAVSRC